MELLQFTKDYWVILCFLYIKDAYSTFINILNGKPSEVAAAVDAKE